MPSSNHHHPTQRILMKIVRSRTTLPTTENLSISSPDISDVLRAKFRENSKEKLEWDTMKCVRLALTAAAVAGVMAQPHELRHRHVRRHSQLHALKRNAPSAPEDGNGYTVVVTEVVKEYVMGGQVVQPKEAEMGLEQGLYAIVGESTPSTLDNTPPVAQTTIAAVVTVSAPPVDNLFKQSSSSSASSTASSTPTAVSTPTPSHVIPVSEPSHTSPVHEPSHDAPAGPAGGASGSTGAPASKIDEDFPNGELSCDDLPTDYGALPVFPTNANRQGWASIMSVKSGISLTRLLAGVRLDNIDAPMNTKCGPGMLCSHACPEGYQKTQWPGEGVGATGQSVGGLWCGLDNKLYLTRPTHSKICEKGVGNVYARNKLQKNVAVCRTDYPGLEAMNIPLDVQPGATAEVTVPDSKTYYWWQGNPTSAQYYINNKGVAVADACTWDPPEEIHDSAGNWAPLNLGTSLSTDGTIYTGLFRNKPTTSAVLNFGIEISVDGEVKCIYRNDKFIQDGSAADGCTVGSKKGQKVFIDFVD